MGLKDLIAHQLFLIQVWERSLAEGRSFVKQWPDKERFLVESIDSANAKIKDLKRGVARKRQTQREKLQRLEEQAARLRREVEAMEGGGILVDAAPPSDPPVLDCYGDPLQDDPEAS